MSAKQSLAARFLAFTLLAVALAGVEQGRAQNSPASAPPPPAAAQPAPTPEQLATMARLGVRPKGNIFDPKGCRRCLNTGFFGRRTVVELLQFNQALREVILKTPTMQEIIKTLGPDNYVRLAENGYHLVADGVTSFDEVDRAVM